MLAFALVGSKATLTRCISSLQFDPAPRKGEPDVKRRPPSYYI
jgi:hypothetical protein